MAIRRKQQTINVDDPLRHADHSRPVTRREFIRQGFLTGAGTVMGSSVFSLFANPRLAQAQVADDLQALADDIGCQVGGLTGDKKIPFLCFDLAGGANIAGSNVLLGNAGGTDGFPLHGGIQQAWPARRHDTGAGRQWARHA